MGLFPRRRSLAVLGLLTTVVALSIPMAHADNVVADGDGVVPVVDNNLSLGTVCANTTTSKPIVMAISRQGNAGSTNVYPNSAVVTFTASVSDGRLSATFPDSTITLPANWGASSNNTMSPDTATATVTFASGAAGTLSGTATFTGTAGSLVRSDTVTVSATVQNCDSTPPTLNLPSAMTIEATSSAGATVSYAATADDANPAHPSVTCSPASGSTFPIGISTVNCSATDAAGNSANGSFTVTVGDTTGPVLGAPSDVTAEASGASGAVVTYTSPTATDAVDGVRSVSCLPASGSTFSLGTTVVTCTASDTRENSTESAFSVTVEDTTKPTLTLPADLEAEATSAAGAVVTFSASATDTVDSSVDVLCSPASGSTFALGTAAVTCSAADDAGNTTDGTFNVTVEDTTGPVFSGIPAGITKEATGPSGAAATFTEPTASDAVDGPVTVSCDAASGSTFALGETTVTCTASDIRQNLSTASFTVSVVDTTAPALTLPADMTVEATGPSGAAATFSPSAVDLVDGPVTVECTPASGSTLAIGEHDVSCTATDAAENVASGGFKVTVVDTTGPLVAVPADITVGPTGPSGAAVTYSGQSATDLVDGPRPVSCDVPSGSVFGFGATEVTCTATDETGNVGTSSFTVTVSDFTFLGFFQPIDAQPALNTVKAGSTVPVKWKLQGAAGLEITSTTAVAAGWPKATKMNCSTSAVEDLVETTSTGGTSLRYDTTGAQFIYNWQTPKQPGTCWTLDVKFADGAVKSASFKLK
jgi:hypothetical protein